MAPRWVKAPDLRGPSPATLVQQFEHEARAGCDLDALRQEVVEQSEPRGVGVGDGGEVQVKTLGPPAASLADVAHDVHHGSRSCPSSLIVSTRTLRESCVTLSTPVTPAVRRGGYKASRVPSVVADLGCKM